MSQIKIYLLIILFGFIGALNSCTKSLEFKDVVYFTGTEISPEVKFTIEDPSSIGISVTSSEKVKRETKIEIAIVPEMVDGYNKMTGKTYSFLPDNSYELDDNSVTIDDGVNVSESVKFSIISLDDFAEGTTYCVPITIVSVDDKGLGVLEASRTMYLIINRKIITQATSISPNYFTVGGFQSDPNLNSISNLTLECRVLVNQFQTRNPFISSVMGIEENFLLRFGDVSIDNDQLQLAGGLINSKKYPVTTNAHFSTGVWYHVAVVYNGSTISLYVNGVLDNYTDAESGGIDLTDDYMGGFHIGYSSDGRLLNGAVSEARVWTKALTPNELQNNLCFVDPTTEGLLAYWRFNDADNDGNVTDLTGHGYTAKAARSIIWVEGVRCPN